jgi:protein-tyrosine phosphatase
LFVCTGNICRSPIAERLAVAYGTQAQIPELVTSSAGTRAVIGSQIHASAASVLVDLGGDPSDFIARQLTPRIASSADLILTLTRAHRDAVLEMAPQRLRRTFTLSEASRISSHSNAASIADLSQFRSQFSSHDVADIADPIGHDHEFFELVGAQIAELLPPIIELLR